MIVSKFEETIFCNTKSPPDVFMSKASYVTIKFHPHIDQGESHIQVEGFRLHYSTIKYSREQYKDKEYSRTKGSLNFIFEG